MMSLVAPLFFFILYHSKIVLST